MSDLCMYELDDILWDELRESDDHIVPHPGGECGEESVVQSGNRKKPRHEIVGVMNNIENKHAAKYFGYQSFPTLKKQQDSMLEKGSWSHAPDGGLPASCDSDPVREVTGLASDDSRMSNCFKSIDSDAGEFHGNDSILCDSGAAVNNVYHYPLSHISHAENDLSFLDNDRGDKESCDLLYYGWPDIENFEDVDRMFRSCDSTFGLGSVGNEDELCWFSSSNVIEGSEDAAKSGFKFPCSESSVLGSISEHHEPSRVNNAGSLSNDSKDRGACISFRTSSCTSDAAQPIDVHQLSFTKGSNATPERKSECAAKEQINLHKKQYKQQNHSEGKRKDRNLENGTNHCGNLKQLADVKAHLPYVQPNYSYPSDQILSSPAFSGIKSENSGHPSLSLMESSYASNQVLSQESCHDPSLEVPTIMGDVKREEPYSKRGLQASFNSNPEQADLVVQAAFCEPVTVQKQLCHCENEVECHSETGGVSVGVPAELDSSYVQESSCVSSLDVISLEATSFRQLQQVMEQLDIRTKLCIRDSLYRLARSAEQRHSCEIFSGCRDVGDTTEAMLTEEPNKGSGFIDMETDTNPIDRSIAHLLFHRPSDQSLVPTNDALSHKSHTLICGSLASPPALAEKLICDESAADGDETMLVINEKN